ncbi:MAG: hypothetical protein AAB916_01515 [Patescibacteria group bacterium]
MTHFVAVLTAILCDIAHGFFFLPEDSAGFSPRDTIFARKLLRETLLKKNGGTLSVRVTEVCRTDPDLCLWAKKKMATGETQFARHLWIAYRVLVLSAP